MRDRGWIRIHELADGETVEIGGVTVRPFRLAEDYVYAFELTEGDRRLLVAMDELNGWSPPADVTGCDLAVLPMGICEFDLFTGERLIHEEHPVLVYEATFAETLGIVDALDAGAGRPQPRRGDGLHLLRRPAPGRAAAAGRGAQRRLRLGRHDDRRVTERMEPCTAR